MTYPRALTKFDAIVKRLVAKINYSQAPVPGFLISVSGTDSLAALWAVYKACIVIQNETGRAVPITAIHYVDAKRLLPGAAPSKFVTEVKTWLWSLMPGVQFVVATPLGGNQDQQRWADLHLRALNKVIDKDGVVSIVPLGQGENFWVVGTTNATEYALNKYSILSRASSIQPIHSLWKSEVLEVCASIAVPAYIMESARLPDCLCGREELAAENIELLDAILRDDYDPAEENAELVKKLLDYIREHKRDNGFRMRIPYLV